MALFLFRIALANWSLLWFHTNLMIFCSSSSKNDIGVLVGIGLNLYIALGNMATLTLLILPTHDHGISFHIIVSFSVSLFKRFYLFSERGEGREKERERNIDVQKKHQLVASHMPPNVNLACNPGMCPDWELNWEPFSSQASAQTEPHQPGCNLS